MTELARPTVSLLRHRAGAGVGQGRGTGTDCEAALQLDIGHGSEAWSSPGHVTVGTASARPGPQAGRRGRGGSGAALRLTPSRRTPSRWSRLGVTVTEPSESVQVW